MATNSKLSQSLKGNTNAKKGGASSAPKKPTAGGAFGGASEMNKTVGSFYDNMVASAMAMSQKPKQVSKLTRKPKRVK